MRPLPAIAACLFCASAAHAELSRNLTAAYADTKLAMQNGAGSIVCIGDSLTFRPGAFFENFRPLIANRYGDGGLGYRGCSIWTGALLSTTAWNRGVINTDVQPFHSLDGMWASHIDSVPGWIEISAYNPSLRLHYTATPTGGSFIARYPNGTFERIQTHSAVNQVRTLSITMPPGSEPGDRVRFEPQPGGSVTFLGWENQTQNPGPRLHRVANGGWGVSTFLRRNWTFDQQLSLLQPSMFIVMLGQNDSLETRATFSAKMIQLIDRLRAAVPNAEIVLVSSYDGGAPWNVTNAQGMEDAAIARGTGFINLFEAAGNHAFFQQSGFLDTDGLHWLPAGGNYVAHLILGALESGGVSLLPCSDIDFNNDGLFPDTADIDALLAVFSGGPCPAPDNWCDAIDFNRDGLFPDTTDIDTFLHVFSGGTCGG
ncbi:MAG TPA: GDSL-type esterase/lipase family protein [Phycisphaerales bacterium]|nr:GDSL-type esterase/lipase family protein [Phycisphaerales bacterium]